MFLQGINLQNKYLMKQTTILLKNMVCSRCITVVRYELEKLGVKIVFIDLTKMKIQYEPNIISLNQIRKALERNELGIVENKEEILVTQIKQLLYSLIHHKAKVFPKRISQFIADEIGCSYNHLSRLFTKHENITIEKYLILLKIERVKELLEYDEQSLSDISKTLAYSSTQHLSRQFKLTTGISISDYKKFLQVRRISADKF